jgi:hypothetical protein
MGPLRVVRTVGSAIPPLAQLPTFARSIVRKVHSPAGRTFDDLKNPNGGPLGPWKGSRTGEPLGG